MAMVNMKLSPSESKDDALCCTDAADRPAYPYCLSISLNDDVLRKLPDLGTPGVGQKLTLHAIVEVTSVSQYETQGSKDRNIGLQITDMELTAEGTRPDAAEVLFGGGAPAA